MRRLAFILTLALLPALAVQAQQVRTDAPETAAQLVISPEQMPSGYLLESVYPNPFNPSASVGFAVTRAQRVELALYDALGRKVRTLFGGVVQPTTRYEAQVDGSGLPSGLYLVRLTGDGFSTTRRVTLLK